MSSIIPGFEYDIFISYRHNDNLDGWVTDFVLNLERELKATVKKPLTIYFDKNPHDGLLETHNVNKSLEGKLKCLIFIPVISQTYCDQDSFAWQHEFCAFNKLASADQFGRDIKLSSGNVASRILPVKIHDLDAEDKNTIENEINGTLRPIDFIYTQSGVNRPLTSLDHKEDNSNKTFYRDQINKTANAVKQIIAAFRSPVMQEASTKGKEEMVAKHSFKVPLIATLLFLLFSITVYVAYSFLQPANPQIEEVLDKSIAVLPFVDLSESKDQGWFSDGLTEEILNSLAHLRGLDVAARTSSFSFKGRNMRVQDIADSLGVNYVVEGSVRKSNAGVRITAQLIRARDGFHMWSNTYDRKMTDILVVQQDIATDIAESLSISLDPQAVKKMQRAGTTNPDAFLAFLKGLDFFRKGHNNRNLILPNLQQANINFDKAIAYDPDFVNAYIFHADLYLHYLDRESSGTSDTMTLAEAHRLMVRDFDNAVAKSGAAIEKDFYQLHSIMYSHDWSEMKPIIERLLKSPDAARLFTYQSFSLARVIYCLGYNEFLEVDSAILRSEPNNIEAQRDIIWYMISNAEYGQVIQTLDQLRNNQDPELNFGRFFSLYQLQKIEEAYDFINRMDSSTIRFYNTSRAMILAKKGDLAGAKKIIENDKRLDYLLFDIDAVYGRQAANLVASRIDKKPADVALLFSFFYSPRNPPFDFSATPNLVRKLSQAGVTIKQNP
jgi:TolB-like protein